MLELKEYMQRQQKLIFFSAHPDDESFGVGGTLAQRILAQNRASTATGCTKMDPSRYLSKSLSPGVCRLACSTCFMFWPFEDLAR